MDKKIKIKKGSLNLVGYLLARIEETEEELKKEGSNKLKLYKKLDALRKKLDEMNNSEHYILTL